MSILAPDSELLRRFRAGDTGALDEVYRAYSESITRVVAATLRRYGGGAGVAAGWRAVAADLPDLVQEVFMRAFAPEARRRYDGVRDYGPYLGQIARNVTVDYLRRRRREVTRQVSDDIDALAASVSAASPGAGAAGLHAPPPDQPADDFADPDTMNVVARYLASLPDELRRVHELLYVRTLSQREAAAALGLGRQVIRTLEQKLRDGLRQALAEAGAPPAGADDRSARGQARSG